MSGENQSTAIPEHKLLESDDHSKLKLWTII